MVDDAPAFVGTAENQDAQIRTFLIADVRGYTVFTQERGDEAAARLATKFAAIAREVLESRGGTVVELRGDEALVVFDSARQAIRASIDLQRRFVDETVADPALPLPVGIGLDAGEAVPVDGGFRGGALNLAARLCSIAGPAEILASREVVHLARKVEGVAYVDRGSVRLKGLADPVHVIRLRAEAADAAEDMAFRRALGSAASRLVPAVPGAIVPNPYKGLRAFEETDAVDFFGREELVEQLVKRLSQTRFLAVVGPSGSGKSSAVRAGLLPAIRRGAIPASEGWRITDMFPGAHPLDGLEAALLRAAPDPPASLMDQLERDEHGLHRAVLRLLPSDGSELVLVIDQFEEVFTLVEDEAVRTHFLGSLEAAANDPRSRLRVVATLRADFYDRPLMYRGFAELFKSRVEAVIPLSAEEVERAISGPAKRVDVSLEPGLVAAMLADVAEEPGALPLLEYALTELFERRDGRVLFLEAYREIGGVSGALGRRAEELFAELDDRRQGGRAAAVPPSGRAGRGDGGHAAPRAPIRDRLARHRPGRDDHGDRHVRRLPPALLRPGRSDRCADDRARARGDPDGLATAPPMDRRRAGGPPHGAPPRRLHRRLDRGGPGSVVPAHRLALGAGRKLAGRVRRRGDPGGARVHRGVSRGAGSATGGGGGSRSARTEPRTSIRPAAPSDRGGPRRGRPRRGGPDGLRDRPAAGGPGAGTERYRARTRLGLGREPRGRPRAKHPPRPRGDRRHPFRRRHGAARGGPRRSTEP